MHFSWERTINLGKFGLPYESLKIGVTEADSWQEAEQAVKEEQDKIVAAFQAVGKKRLDKLNAKIRLTAAEDRELEEIRAALEPMPF